MIDLNELSNERVLKQKDIRELSGWSRSTFHRRVKTGQAPKMLRVKIGSEVGYSSWLLPMEPPTQDRSRIRKP